MILPLIIVTITLLYSTEFVANHAVEYQYGLCTTGTKNSFGIPCLKVPFLPHLLEGSNFKSTTIDFIGTVV